MTELKPCPFCWGEVSLEKYTNPYPYTDSEGKTFWREEPDGWVIECKHHGWSREARGVDVAADIALYSWDTSEENKRALIEEWNTRAEKTCKDVEPRAGYWECSECGVQLENPLECPTLWLDGKAICPSFCPNCGAKVVGD